DFGFPESHSYSFAYLVYASAWLKVHHPEAFYAGLLAAQPMGFYSPQTLAADARRRGVRVLGPDVHRSGALAEVERVADDAAGPDDGAGRGSDAGPAAGALAVRLGLAQVRGVGKEKAEQLVAERERGPFRDVRTLVHRVELSVAQLEAL